MQATEGPAGLFDGQDSIALFTPFAGDFAWTMCRTVLWQRPLPDSLSDDGLEEEDGPEPPLSPADGSGLRPEAAALFRVSEPLDLRPSEPRPRPRRAPAWGCPCLRGQRP